jgi:hypothetical protein
VLAPEPGLDPELLAAFSLDEPVDEPLSDVDDPDELDEPEESDEDEVDDDEDESVDLEPVDEDDPPFDPRLSVL